MQRMQSRAGSITEDPSALLKMDLGCLLQDGKLSLAPSEEETIKTAFNNFHELFCAFQDQEGPDHSVLFEHSKIQPLPPYTNYTDLPLPNQSDIKSLLEKLVVVKLNGGLGTTMGCEGPKSIIKVRDELTFLDITVQQIEYLNKKYDTNVPLVLMNSFNTDKDTKNMIKRYSGQRVEILTFNQSCFPRINKETLLTIAKDININNDFDAWYPPGHGDFYQSFLDSGLLESLEEGGRKYAFISNVDNMAGITDLRILNKIVKERTDFALEVTKTTQADVKGTVLARYEDRYRLIELHRTERGSKLHDAIIQNSIFNTNNLWVSMPGIRKVAGKGLKGMEALVNMKTLRNGTNVIQLETHIATPIKFFEDSSLIVDIPRSRFLPVKKTTDLMLVMSNIYTLDEGTLTMTEDRVNQKPPLVELGEEHFKEVKEFSRRLKHMPDLVGLNHLTVSGDVHFGKNVSLRGRVLIAANPNDVINIPDGSVLENTIVTGALRMFDTQY